MTYINHHALALQGLNQSKRQINILFKTNSPPQEILKMLIKFEANISFAFYSQLISQKEFEDFDDQINMLHQKLQEDLNRRLMFKLLDNKS